MILCIPPNVPCEVLWISENGLNETMGMTLLRRSVRTSCISVEMLVEYLPVLTPPRAVAHRGEHPTPAASEHTTMGSVKDSTDSRSGRRELFVCTYSVIIVVHTLSEVTEDLFSRRSTAISCVPSKTTCWPSMLRRTISPSDQEEY